MTPPRRRGPWSARGLWGHTAARVEDLADATVRLPRLAIRIDILPALKTRAAGHPQSCICEACFILGQLDPLNEDTQIHPPRCDCPQCSQRLRWEDAGRHLLGDLDLDTADTEPLPPEFPPGAHGA